MSGYIGKIYGPQTKLGKYLGTALGTALLMVPALISIAIPFAMIYIAWHFISKYW